MKTERTRTTRNRIETAALVALGLVIGTTIVGGAYAATTVGSTSIKTNAVLSRHIKAGNVTRTDLRVGAVGGAQLAAGAVGSSDLADGAVASVDIADGAVGSADIGDGAVAGVDIADGAVGSLDIADGAVGSADIADGAIGTADIADGAVSAAKLGKVIGAIAPTAQQATTTGSPEVMELGNTIFDSANMHANGVDSILITVAGVYQICVNEPWWGDADGIRELYVRKNSVEMYMDVIDATTDQFMTVNQLCFVAPLAVDDVMDVQIMQNSGGNLYAGGTGPVGQFSVIRMGAA